jgi:hypothetical protein
MTLGLAMCMGILKIGNHAMVSIAEGMGQVMQQTASQAAGQLSGAGGTNAAADQYIREKARGWAAGMASPRQIENQAVFEYETGLQNAWQNTAFGNTAERLARRSAIDNAINLRSVEAMVNRYGADEYINQMASNKIFGEERTLAEYKQMTELFGDSRLAAITMGTMAANNQYVSAGEMEGMINAMGGVQNLADAKGELSAAGLMENVSRYNTLKELFGGNAEEAYKAMGQMSAESSLISYQDLQTMKGLYGGDVKELADAKAFMSAFNFMQQQGGIDSVKDKMGALGFTSVRQFSEFASNNFALNEEMANRLDAKYNTTAFEEGHRITFDVNSSGGVSNMVAHSTGNVVLVGNKLVQGATEEIRFNESGVLNRTYTGGSIDGKTGTMVLDGNDNAIWTDLKSGSNLALGKATVINQDTLLAIAKGDIKAINSINLFGLDSEARDSVLNQVSHQVERYVQQNSGSGTSAHFTSTTYAEGSMGLDIAGNKAVMGTKVEAGASTSGTSSTMYNQIATGLQRKEDEITTLMKGGLTEKQANEVMARYLGNIYGDAMRMQDTGALRNLFHDNPNYDIFSSTPDKPKGFIM